MANDGDADVKKIVEFMKASPGTRVKLSGNTDSIGDPEANNQLALERAVVVRKKLVDEGIDASRVDVVTLGQRRPVADNGNDQGRAENRRVDAEIIYPTK
jgi:OOP family OmpA-OmpF porin